MRTRDPEAKKAQLLAAALSEFATYGMAGARVERVARSAGISPGLVYSFYEGKDQLFDAVFERVVELAVASVPIDADRLPDYAGKLYDIGLRHPEVIRFLTWYELERGDSRPMAAADSMREKVAAIKAAQRRGTVTSAMPAGQLLALVLAIANMWNRPSEDLVGLVAQTKRRTVILEAVARLVEP